MIVNVLKVYRYYHIILYTLCVGNEEVELWWSAVLRQLQYSSSSQ